jgi:hypothetical protein
MLELQYQTMLDLPFTPMTEASLTALDMAIFSVSTATLEELHVFRAAGLSTRALMTNVQKTAELVHSEITQANRKNGNNIRISSASFDCPRGRVPVKDEVERPPGYCNQSDTQVVDIDYLTDGSNDELFLSDNKYPEDPLLCTRYTSPEVTAGLIFGAYLAKTTKYVADRACATAVFAFFAGGNCELCCIPTDLINLSFKYAAKGVQYCNAIRGTSEGRTTYVRTGELFVQSSENTEFIDSELIAGFETMNDDIDKIKYQTCQNANNLNITIANLEESLRSLRIDDARLLDLFGDQLDPINPVPIPMLECGDPPATGARPIDSSLAPPPTGLPPSVQPTQPELEFVPPNRRGTNQQRQRQ